MALSGGVGGANLGRFAKEGIYVTTETDRQGRFVLEGVALRDVLHVMATHAGYVRHDETFGLDRTEPGRSLDVRLTAAATIGVSAVDAGGHPIEGQVLMRLESKQGKVFCPLREDWPVSHTRTERLQQGEFAFGELVAGAYRLDVIRIDGSVFTYHGGVDDVVVTPGERKEIRLEPADQRSNVTLQIAKDPYAGEQIPGVLLSISRNPGVMMWVNGRFYHPEDHRLGRIQFGALGCFLVTDDEPCRLVDFPVGDYSLIAISFGTYPNFRSPSVYLRGVRVEMTDGLTATRSIPWRDPLGPAYARPTALMALDTPIQLEAGAHDVQTLCKLFNGAVGTRAKFVFDDSLKGRTVTMPAGELSIWDVLERLYLENGWEVEGQDHQFTLRAGGSLEE